jgi:hypothetical protein
MNAKTHKNRIENGFDNGKQLHRNNDSGSDKIESGETDSLPRIVITADDVMMLPSSGKNLSLSREEIDCIVRLTQALRRNIE